MEASIITCRTDVNRAFYGMDVRPSLLLSAAFPQPRAAEPLYAALSEVIRDVRTINNNTGNGNISQLSTSTFNVSSSYRNLQDKHYLVGPSLFSQPFAPPSSSSSSALALVLSNEAVDRNFINQKPDLSSLNNNYSNQSSSNIEDGIEEQLTEEDLMSSFYKAPIQSNGSPSKSKYPLNEYDVYEEIRF